RGRILQQGSPRDVYEQPRTRFVAEFLGTANVIECDVIERRAQAVKLRPHGSTAEIVVPVRDARLSRERAEFAIRPERVVLDAPQPHHVRFDGRIVQHVFRGAHHAYRVDVAALGRPVYAYEMATSSAGGGARPAGAPVIISFDAENAVLLDADVEPALAKAA
ncbi:MAG TPA: TOBE domain-containing protein, partial [Paraburkholderia sp.]|nr:TOBE domain-containing protein [Paraburkholderia sp.]